MEYSIVPKRLGERRIIHYPKKGMMGLYIGCEKNIIITMFVFAFIILTAVFVTIFMETKKYSEKDLFDDSDNVYLTRAKEITGLNLDNGKVIKFFDTKEVFLEKVKFY